MAVIAVSSNATIKHGLLSSTAANRRGVQIRKKITPPIRNTTTRAQSSILSDVTQAPPDPILGVSVAFRECQNPNKLNLGVGAYRTEELKPYVLDVVKLAEKEMLAKGYDKEYLPMQGLAEFNTATAELLLGKDSEVIANKRIATVQSLSGTGSLRVGAAFIQKFLPGAKVYLPSPTWGNHKNIFADAGVDWGEYKYYDSETIGLDLEGMLSDLSKAPEGSVVILHGCAHNPTGVDPTMDQWKEIADVVEKNKLIPFFDVAYQGFASGDLETDAASVRLFAERGIEFFCAQSYSKNLGLYAERIGAINAVLSDSEYATKTLSQLNRIARAMYSNPPVHGARIASTVINDESLFARWNEEMREMAGRIKAVRKTLYGELVALNPDKDWSFVTSQIGMFSFTGLSEKQVLNMTDKHAIYMTKDGRISLAGLSQEKCAYLANAIDDSFKNA
ncbi:aspartate aminotransferase [bacterium]|nr:aspartate aminotransferase [bacterium]|tara:strand:+ start:14554 stop:15897 length:1344 start_codon:yes stop_codon:yes gene_type:complete